MTTYTTKLADAPKTDKTLSGLLITRITIRAVSKGGVEGIYFVTLVTDPADGFQYWRFNNAFKRGTPELPQRATSLRASLQAAAMDAFKTLEN
jgi:hypothetical protein